MNTTCAADCCGASATSCLMKPPGCQLADEGPVKPPPAICMMSGSHRARQDFQSDVGCEHTDTSESSSAHGEE